MTTFTSEQYFEALSALKPRLGEGPRRMLAAHAYAPGRRMSVSELGRAAGCCSPGYTYLHYGRLGHLLAQALRWRGSEAIWTRFIGEDRRHPETNEVLWTMHPALQVAVQQLGWTPDGLQPSATEEILTALPEFRHLDETTREALVKARLGQGVFRRELIERDGACAVTGCSVLEALVAAHIKPWAVCDNRERLDHSNGILLVGTLDRLFDAGLITFTEGGEIRISDVISRDQQRYLGIKTGMRLRKIFPESEVYLRWHREHRFHGGAA